MGILQRILATKRAEVDHLELAPSEAAAERRPIRLGTSQSLAVIAEIKRRSPSAGSLSTKLGVAERAAVYATAGAAMVSVLCDREFFDGAYSHLGLARQGCTLPLLCKDFIISERQLRAARSWGADAALLIVRCLDGAQTAELVDAARDLELEPLVEVTTESEAQVALDAGAALIGVNARDLDTQEMDAERARRVLESLPASTTRIHLSGLKSASDVRELAGSSADAALVGEALMREDDPAALLREMVAAGRK